MKCIKKVQREGGGRHSSQREQHKWRRRGLEVCSIFGKSNLELESENQYKIVVKTTGLDSDKPRFQSHIPNLLE